MIFLKSCGCLLIFGFICYTNALPNYIKVCHAADPHLSACINNSVNLLRPKLKTGIPELDVPPLEPLSINQIELKGGPSESGIKANISNVQVWGAASFIVTELKPILSKNKFYFKIWLPKLYFTGKYEMNNRILLLDLRGRGPIEGNFTDYKSEVLMQGKKITKNGHEYLKFERMKIRLTIGKARLRLGNLFNNDPILSQVAHDLINENSHAFVNEIKPVLETSLSEKFTEIANKITLKFTYQELFP